VAGSKSGGKKRASDEDEHSWSEREAAKQAAKQGRRSEKAGERVRLSVRPCR